MNKRSAVVLLAAAIILVLCGTAMGSQVEMPSDKYFTLVDEKNHIIHQTALKVFVGDIYISADNSRYEVVDIIGSTAKCKYQGKEKMPTINEVNNQAAFNRAIPVVGQGKPTIAIYHTHSDESYVPTDGKESINGNGGIYDVGKALVQKLKAQGFNVIYNQANHNPHDVNAYNRSRKTAVSLLKKQPDVILDVHRDAVPASEYQTTVKGQDVTKVKLVVGRSNPNMKTNLEFAKMLKAAMDKKEPGLSNGIYMGKGDYNQDLSPRAMLIEVGAHTNSKAEAEKGVQLFANTLPTVLGVSTAAATNQTSGNATPAKKPLNANSQKSGTTILIILAVVAAAAGGFFLLNRGPAKK